MPDIAKEVTNVVVKLNAAIAAAVPNAYVAPAAAAVPTTAATTACGISNTPSSFYVFRFKKD